MGVVGHHGVGRGQDVARGAVVLLQLHHAGVGVVLLEVQDVLDVGAAPRVDGLVVVAHHHEVAVELGQPLGDEVLHMVGVLVLVHRDLDEAPLVAGQHLGVPLEQEERVHEQVVEVHGVGHHEAALELGVDPGRLLGGGVGRLGGHLVGVHHGVLGGTDLGTDHVDGKLLGVDVEVGHDGLDQALGVVVVVDGEVGTVAQELGVVAQDAHTHGVERAHPHAAGAPGEQGAQALAHLRGGLVGERDGQDLPGGHAEVGHHVRDAVREHAGLARAGAGEHEERALAGEDRLALGVVERVDVDGAFLHGVPPGAAGCGAALQSSSGGRRVGDGYRPGGRGGGSVGRPSMGRAATRRPPRGSARSPPRPWRRRRRPPSRRTRG